MFIKNKRPIQELKGKLVVSFKPHEKYVGLVFDVQKDLEHDWLSGGFRKTWIISTLRIKKFDEENIFNSITGLDFRPIHHYLTSYFVDEDGKILLIDDEFVIEF